MKLNALLLVFLLLECSECFKILAIFPYAGKSHFIVFEKLLKELATRGHHVTVLSEFPQEKPIPNYKDLVLKPVGEASTEVINLNDLPSEWITQYAAIFMLSQFAEHTCAKLSQDVVLDLIKSEETYDLILIEYFNTDCFLGFAHKFKVPFIGVSTCYHMPWHLQRFGGPDNPSYMPVHFGDFQKHMTYLERLENTFMYLYINAVYYFLMDIPGNRIAKKHFGEDLPPLHEISYNTSLFLRNTFHSLNGVYPNVPAIIEIGGMIIGKSKRVQPKNIEKFINESTHGVIYFSMGSMIKGDTFPEDKRKIFQKVFARFKERVLWKWENDTMPGKSDNIMIQSWMPQFDILCHPNVKAFITHGGLLGTTESVHCGVPAIVMPQFGDQYTNARALEASGGGVVLHFSTITEEDVYNALKTVLDPSFNKQAKELSVRFKDRPMSPMDTAIYWVEYVARHKGAPHLRSAAVGMPYYQYLLLDVIAFLLLVTFIIFYIFYRILKFIFKKLFGKKPTKVKKQ